MISTKMTDILKSALFIGAACALVSCGEGVATSPSTPSSDGELKAATSAGVATSILNAGVMTEMGGDGLGTSSRAGTGAKFLFDPLYDDHFGSLEQLPDDLIAAIVSGAAPYDNVDVVFVSHAHGDHFSATHLTDMLAAQPQLHLIAPGQAIDRMREDADWSADFEARVTAIDLENGEATPAIEVAGAQVEAFRSPHSGWPDRHAGTHNITFRVSVAQAGGATGRVMHLGDADPAAEHYAALSDFLAAKRSGLAMVPFWFYQQDNLAVIIDATLNAQSVVAVHVPARVPAYLNDGSEPFFSGVGQVLDIPASQ